MLTLRDKIFSIIIVFLVSYGLAVLIWAIQTGRIDIFAEEPYDTGVISVKGQANWDLDDFDNVLVSSIDESIFLDIGDNQQVIDESIAFSRMENLDQASKGFWESIWGTVSISSNENSIPIPSSSFVISPDKVREEDFIKIDAKLENFTGIIESYTFEITELNTNLRAYFKSDTLPTNIKPFSLKPGNFVIKIQINTEDNKFYNTEREFLVTKSDNLPVCNQNSKCTLGKTDVDLSKIEANVDANSYANYLAEVVNRMSPDIYGRLHGEKSLGADNLIDKISVKEDFTKKLAYTKIRFQDLINSPYDETRGIYFTKGNLLFSDLNDFKKFYYSEAMAGVVVHELAHFLKVPKSSVNFNDFGWMEEGISDYVRDKVGYSSYIQNRYPHCEIGQTYLYGYMCAADFFKFIDKKYDKNISEKYVNMLENGTANQNYDDFTKVLFDDYFGKNVNALWEEYLNEKAK